MGGLGMGGPGLGAAEVGGAVCGHFGWSGAPGCRSVGTATSGWGRFVDEGQSIFSSARGAFINR